MDINRFYSLVLQVVKTRGSDIHMMFWWTLISPMRISLGGLKWQVEWYDEHHQVALQMLTPLHLGASHAVHRDEGASLLFRVPMGAL